MEIKKRINWIDWAKVITMVLIVFGHSQLQGIGVFYRDFVYSFHVPFFFFLSGYLYKDSSDFNAFIKQNVKSLMIPYFLLNVVALVMLLPQMAYHNSFTRVIPYIINIFKGNGGAPAGACWFLISLFLVRIYAFFLLKQKFFYQVLTVILLPIATYTLLLFTDADQLRIYFEPLLATFTSLIFFIAGYHTKLNELIENVRSKLHDIRFTFAMLSFIVISLFLLLYLAGLQGYVNVSNFGHYPLLYYPQAIIGCVMMIFICLLLDRVELRLIRVLSSGTILILALHSIVYIYVFLTLLRFFDIELLANVIISIGITISFYYPIIIAQKYFPILIGNRGGVSKKES